MRSLRGRSEWFWMAALCALFLFGSMAGCITAPDSVQRAGALTEEAIGNIETDVEITVAKFIEKLREAYAQGMTEWFELATARLIDEDGKVILTDYKKYMAVMAQRNMANEAWLANEQARIMNSFDMKFATAKNLTKLVNEYNATAGVSPETFQDVLDATMGIAQDLIASERVRDAARELEANAQPEPTDWTAIITQIGQREIQSFLSRQATAAAGASSGVVSSDME